MKKIGIVGGVAWPSTVEYYAGLCQRAEARNPPAPAPASPTMPEMCIESLDMGKAVSFVGNDADETSWSCFDEYHRAALRRLERSGAECAVMASNTPHHRYAEIVRGIAIPVIDMFGVVADACARIGARRVLILGTSTVMDSAVFRAAFARVDVEADKPHDPAARTAITSLIARLQQGAVDRGAARIRAIVRASRHGFAAQSVVCLACTELSLAFPGHKAHAVFELDGIRYVNAMALHIDAAFDVAASES